MEDERNPWIAGRLRVPKLAFWENQRIVREPKSGSIIQILEGNDGSPRPSPGGLDLVGFIFRCKDVVALGLDCISRVFTYYVMKHT